MTARSSIRNPPFRQDLLRVLGEQRCPPPYVGRRRAQLDRRIECPDCSERRMIDIDDELAGDDLRILEHLGVIVDPSARDVVRLERS